MAFSNGNSGGNGRRRSHSIASLSEMNVVPLVDVVLVLLIIFMLTAHVMEFGLEVDVPKVKQTRDSAEELPVVTITRDGELYLNDKTVNVNELAAQVRERFAKSNSVYVRADKGTPWDPIAQVISELGLAKLEVKVVTQPEDSAAKGRK